MTAHWVTAYIGWPYQRCAQGPEYWDCWSFVRHVQKARYGRDVPFMPSPTSWGGVAKAIPQWAAQFGWNPTETPRDGDAVFLARLKDPTHVGIWVADLKVTLHCPIGGSVLHDARHLAAAQWRVRGYFTPGS
ncbi:MAG: NlpC/P60 family protein [Mycobacterium sp.]